MELIERFRGSLLGLAAGDALGMPLEGARPGRFEPITDMIDGRRGLPAGTWTDDTSLALCLAESLVQRQKFDPHDQISRYHRWLREGHLSSTGKAFGIGGTTRRALTEFEKTGKAFCGPTAPKTAGNGSLMRLAPVPLFFALDPAQAVERSGESSRTTHGAATAIDACRFFGALITGAINGEEKRKLLNDHYAPLPGYWYEHPLVNEIDEVAGGSYKRREPPEIRGTGYVVESLEAALWSFYRSDTFEEGCLNAVNLGNDADTTAAVYGQLAGAFYGERAIPDHWLDKLAKRELIESLADDLYELAINTTWEKSNAD